MQLRLKEWFEYNFPKGTASQQLIGMTEELGELAHAHLKFEQGIRGNSVELLEQGKDAIADLFIFAMNYCTLKGWKIEELLESTFNKIIKRDWRTYPKDGLTH